MEAREASKFINVPQAQATLFVQMGSIRAGSVFGPLRGKVEQYGAWYVRRGGAQAIDLLEQKLQSIDPH